MKRKVVALVLALTMVCGMSLTALAADGDAPIEHTFTAYQVFTGTYDDTLKTLADIEWGNGVKSDLTDGNIAKDYAQTITADNAAAVAKTIAANLSGDGFEVTKDASGNYVVNGPAGYYLIVDTTAALSEGDAYNLSQLQIVDNDKKLTINEKKGTVTSYKKVDDVNDSTGEEILLKDSADYDIGDKVPFTLVGSLPADYAEYTTYYYAFEDKDVDGLALIADSIKVYAENAGVQSEIAGYTVTSSANEFTVEFADIKTATGATIDKDTKIVVKYEAELTNDAIIGAKGNPNEMRLKYSNNPNKESYGTTPWDKVIVFTYKAVVNKVDKEGAPLTGAEFALEKYMSDGTWVAKDLAVSAAENGTEGAVFTAVGLDDGIYRITETKAPAGYNKIDPVFFEVTAEHVLEAVDPTLKSIDTTASELLKGIVDKETGDLGTFSVIADNSGVETSIINQKGAVLPSTGGIGTTIFYIIGGVLVVGAGVLLVVRKKMSSEEE